MALWGILCSNDSQHSFIHMLLFLQSNLWSSVCPLHKMMVMLLCRMFQLVFSFVSTTRNHRYRTHFFSKRIFNLFLVCSRLDTTALLVMVITILHVTVSAVSCFKSKLFWSGMHVLILLLVQSVSFFPHSNLEVESVVIQSLVFVSWETKWKLFHASVCWD